MNEKKDLKQWMEFFKKQYLIMSNELNLTDIEVKIYFDYNLAGDLAPICEIKITE